MLAVYLIHYDKPEWTARSLATFGASVGVDLVLTVVDNGGSPPEIPDGVRVLKQRENRGFAGGANAALRDWLPTSQEWIVITAHDLLVQADAFALMLGAGSTRPALGLIAPACDDDLPPGSRPVVYEELDGIRQRDWVSGSCMMIRRSCAQATGFFDEDYGSWWEDIDYGNRARHAGWEVGQVMAARVSTLGRAGGSRAEIQCHANRLLFAYKHEGLWAVPRASWTLVKQAGWAARHGNFRGAMENIAGLPSGLARVRQVRRRHPESRRADPGPERMVSL